MLWGKSKVKGIRREAQWGQKCWLTAILNKRVKLAEKVTVEQRLEGGMGRSGEGGLGRASQRREGPQPGGWWRIS